MAADANSSQTKKPEQQHAITSVWQWVCYGLWELTHITLFVLFSSVLVYFFKGNAAGSQDFTYSLYFLAALVCLLPPAFIVDGLYQKREPVQKHGFAAVIMVLNAVGVFLAALAALITAVMVALSIFVDGDTSSDKVIVVVVALVIALLGGLLFLRIINPERFKAARRMFRYAVVGFGAVVFIMACAGPVRNLFVTRADRLIEDNLSSVQAQIDTYTSLNKKLPDALDKLDMSGRDQAKRLIDSGRVTYKPTTKPNKVDLGYSGSTPTTTYYYELCVTYQRSRGTSASWDTAPQSNYLYHIDHPAGYKCYDLESTSYN